MDESGQNKRRTKKGFFKHYRRHSIQLINALKKWGEHPNAFSLCWYIDGRLEEKPAIKHSEIRFMQYMVKHLEASYPELFEFINEITRDHDEIRRKIGDVMTAYTPITVDQPSFQKFIIDKIASACPSLNPTVKKGLTEDNIYISDYVFRVIFDTVDANESSIVLSENTISENKTRLWYRNQSFALGQGDNRTIKNFSKVLRELVIDNNIKKRVEQYAKLNKKFDDERIDVLHNHINYLHEYIDGGQILAGYPICDLCRLPNISP